MKKGFLRALMVLSLVLLMLAAQAASVPAAVLDFNMDATHPWNASISYGGSASPLVGSNISVDSVLGKNTPLNSGVALGITNGILNFSTGAYLSTIDVQTGPVGIKSWLFAGGGPITITGSIPGAGINGQNTILLSGTITNTTVTETTMNGQSVFEVAVASFVDTKNEELAKYFGLQGGPDASWQGYFNLSFYTSLRPPTSFSTNSIYSGDIINTQAPLPGAFLLLGSGLIGLVGIRRRIRP